ncbi:hypothetical protein QCA50_018036 [Cerrena zonata]|uniref:Uncharacterized protein n=1 Tax=Cerrena zonata TaxID=2478898 RepID=A0AAW0FDX9_9APHY
MLPPKPRLELPSSSDEIDIIVGPSSSKTPSKTPIPGLGTVAPRPQLKQQQRKAHTPITKKKNNRNSAFEGDDEDNVEEQLTLPKIFLKQRQTIPGALIEPEADDSEAAVQGLVEGSRFQAST